VEAHYFKYHTALDKVPYYCSLCHFIGTKGYKPYKVAEENLKKQGKEAEPLSTYIHKNINPLQIGDAHIQKLSWEESQKIWQERTKGATVRPMDRMTW
jgi:hypothetical protein